MYILQVKNLHKSYGEFEALKGLDLNIQKEEIYGLLGPNGAGKSTTIKMLTGILYPDSGECMVAGLNPFEDRKKYTSKLGVVFGLLIACVNVFINLKNAKLEKLASKILNGKKI